MDPKESEVFAMNRTLARKLLKRDFEANGGLEVYGTHYKTMASLQNNDNIAYNYLLDCIEFEPMNYQHDVRAKNG